MRAAVPFPTWRRTWQPVARGLIFTGLFAPALLACTPAPARPAAAAPPSATYRPIPAAHPGGTLVMADWEAPANLDPIHATTASALRVSSLLFAPLWGRDGELLAYPDLVREVPTLENHDVRIGADGVSMTVLVKLVPGLRWSDGEPLTVDDIAFTVDAICSSASGARDSSGFDRIVAQEKRSPTELLWKFGPRPAGTCNLGSEVTSGVFAAVDLLGPRTRVLPRHSLAAIPASDWPAAPFFKHPEAVSGPFAFRASVGTDIIDLAANPHYPDGRSVPGVYGEAKVRFDHPPRLDAITYRFYNGRAALVAGLRAGESQVGFHLLPEDRSELAGAPGSETIVAPTLQGEYLNPNHGVNTETRHPPPWANDPPVLEALALALDRDAVNRAAFEGMGTAARGLFPYPMRAYRAAEGLPERDLPGARRLLEADGWKAGADGIRVKSSRRLDFTLLAPCATMTRSAEQQELVRQWLELGAAVTADCRPRGRFLASYLDHGVNASGAFDMSLYSNNWEPDPALWATFGTSAQIPSELVPGGQNWNRCSSDEIDRAFAAAAAARTAQGRRTAYLQGAAAWLRYNCTIPLLDWPAVIQRSVHLHNFVPNAGGTMETWNAADWWLDEKSP